MKLKETIVALIGVAALSCSWAAPIVSNVRMQQIEGTKDVRITYDLADNVNTQLWMDVSVVPMTNVVNWGTGAMPLKSVEGDVSCWVTPGLNKEVIWHAGVDWNGRYTDMAKATVKATVPNDNYGICKDRNLLFSAGYCWSISSTGGYDYKGRCAYAHWDSSGARNSLETKVVGTGTISYVCKLTNVVSSPYGLTLYVDGVAVRTISDTAKGWTAQLKYKITTPGLHSIRWEYYRGSVSFDVYVDYVEWREGD